MEGEQLQLHQFGNPSWGLELRWVHTTALDAEVNDVMEGIQEEMLATMSAPLHTIPHQDC